MNVEPGFSLDGDLVRLEPLGTHHAQGLHAAAQAEDIWRWLPLTFPVSTEQIDTWIDSSLRDAVAGLVVPFAIVYKPTQMPIGSTRYMEIFRADFGLEIGWTWLNPAYWRSSINTECKFLLLRHAFETLGAMRVALRTDLRNVRSQTAIARLGAVREGVLRNHRIVKNGYRRSTVTFSIIDDEWPAVKLRLEESLARPRLPHADQA
jgi:RimJ/RimL family protein N-acetyltransferase